MWWKLINTIADEELIYPFLFYASKYNHTKTTVSSRSGNIGIHFSIKDDLNAHVKKMTGVRWSQTNKCWYVPLNAEAYKQLLHLFKGKTNLDTSVLKEYLEKRKQVTATFTPLQKNLSELPLLLL